MKTCAAGSMLVQDRENTMGAVMLVNLYITLWHLTLGTRASGNAQNAKCQVQTMLPNGIP